MKKIFIIFILFVFHINFSIANTNIVFIDMEQIINGSKPGLHILKQLKETNDKITKNFKVIEENLKKKKAKIDSQKKIISENEFQSNINNLQLEVKKYNGDRNKIINDFKKLKIDNTNKFLEMINAILVKYSEDNAISIILQKKSLVIGKNEHDITDEIIIIINKNIDKFKIQ
tara:strand:+ start:5335 stop:5853 length:519 start_codon:yes stop_codon:yes gene_type:complete